MASFSIERPFGIYLWDYFSQAYELVTGKPASTFAFVQGVTPLSTNNEGKQRQKLSNLIIFIISSSYLNDQQFLLLALPTSLLFLEDSFS
jgi:hypothetical protein